MSGEKRNAHISVSPITSRWSDLDRKLKHGNVRWYLELSETLLRRERCAEETVGRWARDDCACLLIMHGQSSDVMDELSDGDEMKIGRDDKRQQPRSSKGEGPTMERRTRCQAPLRSSCDSNGAVAQPPLSRSDRLSFCASQSPIERVVPPWYRIMAPVDSGQLVSSLRG